MLKHSFKRKNGYGELNLYRPYPPAGDQPHAIRDLAQGLKARHQGQTLLGVTGSGKTYTIANVLMEVQRPAIVMVHNKTLAAQLYSEFKEFFPKNAVEYFVSYYDYYQPEAYVPGTDTYIEKDSSINDHIEQMRLSCTKALLERKDFVVVATVSSIFGLGAPESYLQMVLHLVRGDKIGRQEISHRLAEMQYKRNDLVFERGSFRVRGDVIDIYPAEEDKDALRVALFDDEVDTLSLFDPLTGEMLADVPRYTIYPKSHFVTPQETVRCAMQNIRTELKEQLAILKRTNKLVEAQRLEQRTLYDLEMMQEIGYCSGIENYSRHLSGRKPGEPPPTLFDYIPPEAVLIVDESHVTVPQIGAMFRGDRSRKETLVRYGFRLPSALDNRPLTFEEWEERKLQTIYVSATPAEYERKHSRRVVELVVRPTGIPDPQVTVKPALRQVEDLFDEIQKTVAAGWRVLVTVLTKKMAENLTDYFYDHDLRVRYLHSDVDTVERVEILRDLRLGAFDVLVGINLLREGLDLPEVGLVAILDADKEGFLRSEISLVQTIGRAARNVEGRVILYADRITGSMQRAMDETKRRRIKQRQFNEQHGISPRSIKKEVSNVMEGAVRMQRKKRGERGQQVADPADVYAKDYDAMTIPELLREAKRLEGMMKKAARELRFEDAVVLRDQLNTCRERTLYAAGSGT